MNIAIATGKETLDNYISKNIDNSRIVNYSEYFFKETAEKFDVVILSNLLCDAGEFQTLLFNLKRRNIRVIYITKSESQFDEYDRSCLADYLSLGLYDVMFFDTASIKDLKSLIDTPNQFATEYIQKLYIKYVNNTEIKAKRSKNMIASLIGNKSESNSTVIEKVVEVEKIVEKIVEVEKETIAPAYQKVITVCANDNELMRDFFSANLGSISAKNKRKTILIDMTDKCKILNFFDVKEIRGEELGQVITQSTVDRSSDIINENFKVLRTNKHELQVDVLKELLFTLRDYGLIVIAIDSDYFLEVNKHIITYSSEIYLIQEPTSYSARTGLDLVKKLEDIGQVKKNIKIVASDILDDIDVWEHVYSEQEILDVDRKAYIEAINDEKMLFSKADMAPFNKILGINNEKSLLSKLGFK